MYHSIELYDFRKFKSEHPYSGYKFGFCIVRKEGNYVPEGCNDWNDSPEEALQDYFIMHEDNKA